MEQLKRENGFVCVIEDHIFYFDLDLKEIWKFKLVEPDQSSLKPSYRTNYIIRSQLLSLKDYIVLLFAENVIFFDENGIIIATYLIPYSTNMAFVLNQEEIGLFLIRDFYLFGPNKGGLIFTTSEVVKTQGKSVTDDKFICEIENKRFAYRVAIFDLNGNLTIILDENQIQNITVDKNGNIIVVYGSSVKMQFTEQLKPYIRVFSSNGQEIIKINPDTHVTGLVTVSEKGELVYFTEGSLVYRYLC